MDTRTQVVGRNFPGKEVYHRVWHFFKESSSESVHLTIELVTYLAAF